MVDILKNPSPLFVPYLFSPLLVPLTNSLYILPHPLCFSPSPFSPLHFSFLSTSVNDIVFLVFLSFYQDKHTSFTHISFSLFLSCLIPIPPYRGQGSVSRLGWNTVKRSLTTPSPKPQAHSTPDPIQHSADHRTKYQALIRIEYFCS